MIDVLHVCASPDRKMPWAVRKHGAKKALKLFPNKRKAIDSALRRPHAALYIHGRDGSVQVKSEQPQFLFLDDGARMIVAGNCRIIGRNEFRCDTYLNLDDYKAGKVLERNAEYVCD